MPPSQKLRIIVGGLVGQFPLGGVAWDYFHYVLGLHQLGHDVYYHEDTWVWPFDPIKRYPTDDPGHTAGFIKKFFDDYAPQLSEKWHYRLLHDKAFGMSVERFDEIARSADIYLNVSGACFFPDSLSPRCVKVFLDTDPGYNQIMLQERHAWSANIDRWCDQVRSHDRHLTYAENIYGDDCLVPRMGFDWRPTRCVATLAEWAAIKDAPPADSSPFTTIMTWDYFKGALTCDGVEYRTKVYEFERFAEIPRNTDAPLQVAIGGHKTPVEELKAAGWELADAHSSTLTPQSYQRFIAESLGEWSVAKNVYVAMHTGWFSCRTACYLAAGRPAVVQNTAWTRFLPSDAGLLAFDTMEQAVDGLNRVRTDYARHRDKAYAVAREFLAPDRVLPPMIDAIFASSHTTAPLAPGMPKDNFNPR